MQRNSTSEVKKYFETINVAPPKNKIDETIGGSTKTPQTSILHRKLSVTIAEVDDFDKLYKSNISDEQEFERD